MAKQVLNDEMFTILVLMALFTTFITTPTVMAIYKPSRAVNSQICRPRLPQPPRLTDLQEELRILACIHGTGSVPSLINFVESIRANKKSKLKLYIMQLVELTDRSSSILMVQRTQKNGFPFINRFQRGAMHDQIATAFQACGQLGKVTVHHLTGISAMSTMHEDICHVAEKKGVAMIIVPFHKRWSGEDEEEIENMGQGWGEVNQRLLQSAPCSVAVLVNREVGTSLGAETSAAALKRVCILFIGGPDDRKVLELGSRMAEHPAIRLAVVRFTSYKQAKDEGANNNSSISANNWEIEKELDEVAVNEFKSKWHGSVEYIEKDASNITEQALTIGKDKEYELVIVGKGQQLHESTMVANTRDSSPEHTELGPIGDLLTSSGKGITSSVLVIHDETALRETAGAKSTVSNDAISEIESSV